MAAVSGAEALDVEAFLVSLGPFAYFPNPGNAGDSLIAAATFQIFRRLGLDFEVPATESFDAAGRVVVFGGGGNLVPAYRDARDFIDRHHRTARRLILLPHSVAGHEDLLGRLGPNATLICREPVSLAHVRRHAPRAEVLLAHDLGLSLDVHAVLRDRQSFLRNLWGKVRTAAGRDPQGYRAYVSPKYFARDWAFLTRLALERLGPGRGRALNAFRLDAERTGDIPDGNHDLSQQFEYGAHAERVAAYCTRRFVSVINRYGHVNTNRLHVSIAAALLGKTVRLYPNNYFKCQAVYRFSLAERFPNIEWMGD